jgi:uncharacterized membrane protein SirB2
MSRARQSLGGKLILLCLTTWALVVILPDFARVFDQEFNNKLPFEADNNGLLSRNESSAVADCDSIDLKRNYCEGRLPGLLAVFGGMGGMQYVRPDLKNVSLYFVCHNSSAQSSPTAPVSAPLVTPTKWLCDHVVDTAAATSQLRTVDTSVEPLDLAARFMLFVAQVLGVIFIGIALRLAWHRPNAITWGFFLYAIWFNPGQYYVFYAWLERWPPFVLLSQEAAQAVFQAIGYCSFVLFALRFPRNITEPRWCPLERALPYVGVALLFVQLRAFMAVFGFRSEWAARLNFCAGVVVIGVVLAILFIRYREQDQQDRHRIRYVFWGSIFGLAAFTVAELDTATTLLDVRLPESLIYLLYSLNGTVAIAVWHAVRKYRVVDVKFTLSRSGIDALLWMVFAILIIWADSFQTPAKQYFAATDLLTKIGIVSAVFIVLMLVKGIIDWMQGRAEKLFDSLFFRKMRQAEIDLAKLSDKLAHTDGTTPPERVDEDIVTTPIAALALASAAVFRRQQDGRFSRTLADHWPDDAIKVLTTEHDLIKKLQSRGAAPLLLEPNQLPQDVPQGPASPALAVPIIYSGRLEAVALYGAHCEGDDLNEEEIQMLDRLANAASSAYMAFELKLLRIRTEIPGVATLIASPQP